MRSVSIVQMKTLNSTFIILLTRIQLTHPSTRRHPESVHSTECYNMPVKVAKLKFYQRNRWECPKATYMHALEKIAFELQHQSPTKNYFCFCQLVTTQVS